MKDLSVRNAVALAGLWLVAAAALTGQSPGVVPAPTPLPPAPLYVEKKPPTSPARRWRTRMRR